MNFNKIGNIVSYCWKNRRIINKIEPPYYGGFGDNSIKHLTPEIINSLNYAIEQFNNNINITREEFTRSFILQMEQLVNKKELVV